MSSEDLSKILAPLQLAKDELRRFLEGFFFFWGGGRVFEKIKIIRLYPACKNLAEFKSRKAEFLLENFIIIERLGETDKYLPFYQFSFLKGIGRNTLKENLNYLSLENPLISAKHVMIEFSKGNFYLFDLGSENGTFVKTQGPLKLEQKRKIYISRDLSFNFESNLKLATFEFLDQKRSFKLEFSKENILYFGEDGKHSFSSQELLNVQFKIIFDGLDFYLESIAG